jgi:hypothetical protein
MIDRAVAEGLGRRAELEARFHSWQRFGLVGKASAKTHRRGGEGLWDPVHERVFFDALARDEGTPLWAYASYPVGLWFLGADTIGVVQAQRALFYWVTHGALGTAGRRSDETPTGTRSFRERMLRTVVRFYSDAEATPTARARLLAQLRAQLDGVAATRGGVPTDFLEAFLRVASPGRPSTDEERALGVDLYRFVRFWVIAAEAIDVICADRADVSELWGWVRRYAAADLTPGTDPTPRPEWARNLDMDERAWDRLYVGLWISPARVLTILGVALRTLAGGAWSDDWIRPPEITNLPVNSAWAAPDTMLDQITRTLGASP